jgi:2-methylfumaryl-CoA isomerase
MIAAGAEGCVLLSDLGPGGTLPYEALRRRRSDVISVEIEGDPDGRSAVDYTVAAGTGVRMITGPRGHVGPVDSPPRRWKWGGVEHPDPASHGAVAQEHFVVTPLCTN